MKTKAQKSKTEVFGPNSVFAGMAKHSRESQRRHIKALVKNLKKAFPA